MLTTMFDMNAAFATVDHIIPILRQEGQTIRLDFQKTISSNSSHDTQQVHIDRSSLAGTPLSYAVSLSTGWVFCFL